MRHRSFHLFAGFCLIAVILEFCAARQQAPQLSAPSYLRQGRDLPPLSDAFNTDPSLSPSSSSSSPSSSNSKYDYSYNSSSANSTIAGPTVTPHPACQVCRPGYFSDMLNSSSPCAQQDFDHFCAPYNGTCPYPSTEQPDINGTLCSHCPPYTYSLAGADRCHYCSTGSEVTPDLDGCQKCGQWQTTSTRNRTCHECDVSEYFVPLPTGPECLACPHGFIVVGHTNCTTCQPGFNSSNWINCTKCDNDWCWSDNCLAPCSAGSHNTYTKGFLRCTGCDACEMGTFSKDSAVDNCTLCFPGTFQDQTGQTTCKACADGEYQPNYGAGSCKDCPEGSYCNATSIFPCPSDMYCPAGSTSPSSCGTFFEPSSGNTACKPSWQLIAIIAGSCCAFALVIGVLIYRYFRRNRSQYEQLPSGTPKEPVYTGL